MKKLAITASLVLAATSVLAAPASAATWNNPGQIRSELNQLDKQIDRLRLNPREEQRLANQVDRLQDLYRSYARGGFTRSELQRLDQGLSALRNQVYAQAHDRNGRNDDHGRYGGHDRNHR